MLSFFRKIRKSLINSITLRKPSSPAGRYLLYAIGEIALVVVGILIALQINNWNQHRINQNQIQSNIPILLESLQKDSVGFAEDLMQIHQRKEKLDQYRMRLTDKNATRDTLIKIAKDEFTPAIWRVKFNNLNAYNSLVFSGELKLFEKPQIEVIFDYYSDYQEVGNTSNNSYNSYLTALIQYHERFTTFRTTLSKGPIHDKIWRDIDVNDLGPRFNIMIGLKSVYYDQMESAFLRLLDKNQHLLMLLKEAQKK